MDSEKIELVNKYDLFLVGKVIDSILYAWIYIVGSPIEARNYSCSISVTDKSGNKFAFYGQAVKSLDEGPKKVIAKQAVFMIGTEVIKNSKDEHDKLSVEVTIIDLGLAQNDKISALMEALGGLDFEEGQDGQLTC